MFDGETHTKATNCRRRTIPAIVPFVLLPPSPFPCSHPSFAATAVSRFVMVGWHYLCFFFLSLSLCAISASSIEQMLRKFACRPSVVSTYLIPWLFFNTWRIHNTAGNLHFSNETTRKVVKFTQLQMGCVFHCFGRHKLFYTFVEYKLANPTFSCSLRGTRFHCSVLLEMQNTPSDTLKIMKRRNYILQIRFDVCML